MPSLRLTNLASFRAYFQALADSHTDITGFRWGNMDVVKNDNRSDLPDNFLWAQPYETVKYLDKHSDNVMKRKVARIAFMKVRESERFADEEADYELCEEIIDDIVTRIMRDKRGELVGNEWQMLLADLNTAKGSPVQVTIGSTRYIGWDLEIEIHDNKNLLYNPAKWNN